jgi:MFS family permease
MQQVAMSWLVFELTHDPFYLGLVLFCGQIPALFLAPVAGVLTDRWNRHRMLLATQSVAMAQAFLLAFLDLAGLVAIWHIILLSLLLGVVNTFDMTARQAFLTEMVTDREDLGNAIALNSSVVNGARLVGPSLAGLVLAKTSAGVCFLLNGVS